MDQVTLDKMTARSLKYATLEGINMAKVPLSFSKHASESKDASPVFLGWEWEVNVKDYLRKDNPAFKCGPPVIYTADSEPSSMWEGSGAEWVKQVMATPLKNLINVGHGGEPIEMRSVPATMKFHRQYMREIFFQHGFQEIFREGSDCGMHIHMDQKAFTILQLKKFIAFVANPDNTLFIEAIGGRSITGECRWCKKNYVNFKRLKNKHIRGYDIVIDPKTLAQKKPEGFKPETDVFYTTKSVAVHTGTSHGTHEFRIFDSPMTEQDFMKRLEFTDALIRFVQQVRSVPRKLTAFDFTQFVLENSKDYDYLLKEPALITQLRQKRKAA